MDTNEREKLILQTDKNNKKIKRKYTIYNTLKLTKTKTPKHTNIKTYKH